MGTEMLKQHGYDSGYERTDAAWYPGALWPMYVCDAKVVAKHLRVSENRGPYMVP